MGRARGPCVLVVLMLARIEAADGAFSVASGSPPPPAPFRSIFFFFFPSYTSLPSWISPWANGCLVSPSGPG